MMIFFVGGEQYLKSVPLEAMGEKPQIKSKLTGPAQYFHS